MSHRDRRQSSLFSDLLEPKRRLDPERKCYVEHVLDLYRRNSATVGHISRNDRRLANSLFDRGVALTIVRGAMAMAALRRAHRPHNDEPLAQIRSLAYFLPVIDELHSDRNVDVAYLEYLDEKLRLLTGS